MRDAPVGVDPACTKMSDGAKSVSKLEPPKVSRQRRIDLRPVVEDIARSETEVDSHGMVCSHEMRISPLSPTPSEDSSSSSMSSPVPKNKKFIRKEKIGQGAQGCVYRCIEVATGKEVAAKVIMTHELSAAELEAIKREVKAIKRLKHSHLVSYYKAAEKKRKQLSIYMEYVSGGSLSSKLRRDGGLDLDSVRRYTRQLCEALTYLHQHRIAHRDIKCANIFLTSDGEDVKLGDFGAFKEIGSVSLVGGLKGTPHWMAPEVIREQQTSEDGWFKADIWSLGCAVIEMLTGHSPWQQYSNPLTAMYQIVSSNNIPTIPADASQETSSFLQRCLQRDPNNRATTRELLEHSFLQLEISSVSSVVPSVAPHHVSTPNHACCAQGSPIDPQVTRTRSTIRNDTAARTPNQLSPTPNKLVDSRKKLSPLSPNERSALRKPSQITRLKPIELIRSSSNQDNEDTRQDYSKGQSLAEVGWPGGITRGASTGILSQLPRLEKTSHSRNEIAIKPVRLRRISTAPNPGRDAEDVLNIAHAVAHRVKLPPLSARAQGEPK